jgi:hypothetical protein
VTADVPAVEHDQWIGRGLRQLNAEVSGNDVGFDGDRRILPSDLSVAQKIDSGGMTESVQHRVAGIAMGVIPRDRVI